MVQANGAKRTWMSRSNFRAATWRGSPLTLPEKPDRPLERYTGLVAELNSSASQMYLLEEGRAHPRRQIQNRNQYDAARSGDQGDPAPW